MFRDMGLAYFEYLSKSFYHYCPSALARILGAYKIKMKRSNANGKSSRFCLFLMENILLGINDNNCAKYDLKGSKKKRFIINKHKG
jgi:1-phosphatidylinositol-3-phosphate 5-kinase